ncbi:MAG: carbohydrate kinase, partial [Bacteroidales bacterium]|nr:carbohydrate kinase [Bacteroidales bacterium]
HEAGALLYYDINFRKSHIPYIPDTLENLQQNSRWSSVVRGRAEDFGYLFGTTDPTEIYEHHIRPLCPYFICTDSHRPIWVFTPHFTLQIPVAPIQTVSTIGAGDNFNAGFLYGIIGHNITKKQLPDLPQETWQQLVAIGQRFSANVCQSIYNYVDEGFDCGI